jgi:hypothetical protein
MTAETVTHAVIDDYDRFRLRPPRPVNYQSNLIGKYDYEAAEAYESILNAMDGSSKEEHYLHHYNYNDELSFILSTRRLLCVNMNNNATVFNTLLRDVVRIADERAAPGIDAVRLTVVTSAFDVHVELTTTAAADEFAYLLKHYCPNAEIKLNIASTCRRCAATLNNPHDTSASDLRGLRQNVMREMLQREERRQKAAERRKEAIRASGDCGCCGKKRPPLRQDSASPHEPTKDAEDARSSNGDVFPSPHSPQ